MSDIDTRLRPDAARWREHLDARPLPEVAVPARPAPRSRWLPLTAAAGVATLVAAVALGAHLLKGSGTNSLTGVRPRPLPTGTVSGGVPVTFVGIYKRGSGDLGERTKRALALLSSTDGRPVRNLAVTTANGFSALADPSRGPNGDVWFVRAPGPCGGRIVRIDAATGRASVVVNRSGVNVGGPVASPDGRWLAFRESSCDPRNSANQLVLRDLSTGDERRSLPPDARGRPGAVPTPRYLERGPAGEIAGPNIKDSSRADVLRCRVEPRLLAPGHRPHLRSGEHRRGGRSQRARRRDQPAGPTARCAGGMQLLVGGVRRGRSGTG